MRGASGSRNSRCSVPSLETGVTNDSDLDVLVRFDGPIHWERYFGAQFYLEDLLGRPVDLVTEKDLQPEVRRHVESEVVNV